MTILRAHHWLQEVLTANRLWLLRDRMVSWITEKLTVDFLCSEDAEYKELFQAMVDFRLELPVHDRGLQSRITGQNNVRRDGSGWVQAIYETSSAKVQLAILLPERPRLGVVQVPANLDLVTQGPPVQETGWAAAVDQAQAATQAGPLPVLQAPPEPRLPVATLGVSPGSTLRSPSASGSLHPAALTAGGATIPTLELGTLISGVGSSRPGMAPSNRYEIPVPPLCRSRFRVPDWYLTQGGPPCDQNEVGMIEDQLGRLSVQVEGVASSLMLGTYACVLKEIADQVFACVDSGQLSDNSVMGKLSSTLTRHGLAQRWSGTFTRF